MTRERVGGGQIEVRVIAAQALCLDRPKLDIEYVGSEADHGLVHESGPALWTAVNATVTVSTTFMAPISIE